MGRRNGSGFDFAALRNLPRVVHDTRGTLDFQHSRDRAGLGVTFQNANLVQTIMAEIEDGLGKEANRFLRDASQDIARDVLIPQLKRAARSSPMRMARAFADTAVPRRDRIVMVQIGGRTPALAGIKRGVGIGKVGDRKTAGGRAATTRNVVAGMAWGSEYGPFPNSRARRKDGTAGADKNTYGQPRRDPQGYWVTQAVTNALPEAHRRYSLAIERMIAAYGKYR